MAKTGTLYVVATPLGNLEDMTMRAVRVLREVDIIAAEDTRHSRKLLDHFGIRARMTSYYDAVEERKAGPLVRELLQGRSIALISDAGTPCIADPGYRLVRAAAESGVPVEVIPGASAVVAALSLSGLPTDRFCFEGFIPAKAAARRRFLDALVDETRTIVLYETARRFAETVEAMLPAWADRPLVVCRELTKLHEEVWRGSVAEAQARLTAGAWTVRGEVVLVLGGAPTTRPSLTDDEICAALEQLRSEGMSLKEAAQRIAADYDIARNKVYRLGLAALGSDGGDGPPALADPRHPNG